MKNNITKLFNLTSVIVDKFKVDKEILVYIRSPRTHCFCPKCEKTTKKIYDRKRRRIVHGVINHRKIVLVIKIRRFKCRYCGNIFTEKIHGISQKRYSDYFQINSLNALKDSSFLSVSKEYKVSIPTLVSFMKENFKVVEYPQGELRLNIDEHSFRGRDLKITIGEINNRKLLAVLKDDRQRTLINYLKMLPEDVKSRISEVCIDMKYSYLVAIRQELPNAKLVIDKFHIIKELIRQMEYIRKIFQQQNVKGFRRINRFLLLKNIENLSEKELNTILLSIENYPVGKMKEIHNTLTKWKPYILNYFYSRTTNAFIEGCHNKIKLIKRTSFGFRNFTNYMMKITLAFTPIMIEFIHTNT